MMKKIFFTLSFLLLLGMLVACSSNNESEDVSNEDSSSENTEGEKEKITIGFSQPTLESPFYISLVEGAQEKAVELGVTLEVIDAQNDIEKQNSDIQSLITKGIDVLLLNPTNPSAVAPSLKAAEQAGIPVITVDRNTEQDVTAYIGRDNEEMGKIAGEQAVELLGGKGKANGKVIELQGDAGGTVMMARHDGFHAIVEQEEGIEIIEGPYSDYIRSKAVSSMQDLLQAHPDVNLVYAHNDDMALGAIQVLKQANKLEDVHIVGIDGLMEAVKQIQEGNFDATVLNDPIKLGELAVETAVKVANGEAVEQYIDGGTGPITKENASDYINENLDFSKMD
ncbi:substrate-binding domain-containing protein [Virgibacillus sp. W0430]|uniref:substrate-binding domain-containing protein n=1 Tax=Virgibacillus sp. W0430 TaxID=3391580 RepID=UPI003F471F2C